MSSEQESVYDLIGGQSTIDKLVDVFYEKIEVDQELRSIFPEDLEPGKQWQKLFLMQLFGGPRAYNTLRGHPRLRMRHMPFRVTARSADLWLNHMLDSIDVLEIKEPGRSAMIDYFRRAAPHMVNITQYGDGIEVE